MVTTSKSSPSGDAIVMLPIDSVSLTSGTQIREVLNESTVARYAAQMDSGQKFPPIIVYRDKNGLWLADGHHRVMAASRCKHTEIRAEVRNGSKADALWTAAEINSKNALPLKGDDIRKAIRMLLEAWPNRSLRSIGDAVGCSKSYVGQIKNQVSTTGRLTKSPDSEPTKIIGKDGKSYPVRKTDSKSKTSASEGNKSGKTETKDFAAPEPSESVQQADEANSNKSPSVETTEQCSSSPSRNTVSQYDQKLMRWLPLRRVRENDSQSGNSVHVPLSAPDRLVACLFESFDTQFREEVLDTFTRAMLANDGKESVLKIIVPLYDDIQKLLLQGSDT